MFQYVKRVSCLLIFCIAAHLSHGQQIKASDTIVIAKPVYGDLCISEGIFRVSAPIHGNVMITGGIVSISDTVSYHIYLLGGVLNLTGYVVGDLRVGGGETYVWKDIGGDLVISGGLAHIERDIVVRGRLLAGGGRIKAKGSIVVIGEQAQQESPETSLRQ